MTREGLVLVPLCRMRFDLTLGKRGERVADALLLFGEIEVHWRGATFSRTHLMMSSVDAPGVKTSLTPACLSLAASSAGIIPPPNTATSPAPFSFNNRITSGKSVMCA